MPKATMHMLAGKICAGKSTLAKNLARQSNAIIVSEDAWLHALYGEEIKSVADYVQYSARLRSIMAPHLIDLLKTGLSVVLDFPANTLANRAWMKSIIEKSNCDHQLHFIDIPDDICKARLRERNKSQDHEFAATDAQFDMITSHFVAPTADEGLEIIYHTWLSETGH